MKKKDSGGKVVCTNKKAYHDYTIEQEFEAGMVLNGPEIKSLRAGKANLKDGYAQVRNNELFLYNVHISPYPYASMVPPDPLRVRKLLLHRREINKLIGKLKEQGYTLVPLKIYLSPQGRAKLALGLAKGKKLYDKRASLKKKETDRELQRIMRRG
ncbi:SsrA-binding protein SmpB [Desulfurivibrio dismutans]|uniref:SsrA-binding protein SmpB n=1 Tax=Desulfurivibrio dismutans TaxID=1398908 RepID=UPI0023DA4BCA|nr:SsrA-binding protein SmpB [Desulfurivibrio alkaliphilus]MDF1615691.1 SsrA-binding protein SmpB [Desulfurivibrio alkaliphilus]